jgi:hypothetical protein
MVLPELRVGAHAAFGLTLYPPIIALVARWLRQQHTGLPGLFAN